MKDKLKVIIKAVRNKLVLFGIRLKDFYKQNKILSSVIVLFLISGIVITFVVFADDKVNNATLDFSKSDISITTETIVDGKSTTNQITKDSSTNEILASNFTTVNYNIHYYLSNSGSSCTPAPADQVTIKATFPEDTPASWVNPEITASASLSDDGRTLTVIPDSVELCSEHHQVISLIVTNAHKDTLIQPTISIQGGSASAEQQLVVGKNISSGDNYSLKTTYDKELSLTTKVVAGTAKLTDGKRNGKFGILLGIDSPDNLTSTKGYFLKNTADIELVASSSKDGVSNYLGLYEASEGKNDYVDVYNTEKKYFANNSIMPTISTSGSVISLTKKTAINKDDIPQTTLESISLVGDKEIAIKQIPNSSTTYTDNSLIKIDDETTYCSPSVNCSKETVKINSDESGSNVGTIPLKDAGDYEVHYTVSSGNNKTVLIKKITVLETTTSSDNYYSLAGPNETEVVLNSEIPDNIGINGLYMVTGNSETSSSVSIVPNPLIKYYSDSEGTTEVETSNFEAGKTYYQKYFINEEVVATRKIYAKTAATTTSSPKLTVKNEYNIAVGGVYKESDIKGLKINDSEISCDSSNKCSVMYFKSDDTGFQNPISTLDTKLAGEYFIRYTITNNNYNSIIYKKINIINPPFILKINQLGTNGNLVKIENSNFYAIGSYFVTSGPLDNPLSTDTSDNKMCLTSTIGNSANSSCIMIKNYNDGASESTASNDLYVSEYSKTDESSDLVKVDSDEKNGLNGNYFTAAMGEEIQLQSNFEYSYNADNNIKTLNINVPVNKNLIPITYFDNIQEDNLFYHLVLTDANGTRIDSNDHTITIKYCTTETGGCAEPSLDGNYETTIIDHILLTVSDVEPGTKIQLDTKYKVRTITDSSVDLSNLYFNSKTIYSWDSNNNTITKESSTHNVYLTPYKIRTNVGIGKSADSTENSDISLDASKNDVYTVSISPNIISPAMNEKSNVFGYNRIATVNVKVTLPEGINYVYNKDYEDESTLLPTNVSGNVLTFTYNNLEPNAWIDPIYFDINMDTNTINNSVLPINVEVGDLITNNLTNDVSSSIYKIINRTITVNNLEELSYGQYIYNNKDEYVSNIDKNETFKLSTKLHNNNLSSSMKNINVYTVLPYSTDNKESYTGTFEVSLPIGAKCTSDPGVNVTSSEQVNNISWNDCSSYKLEDGNYSGLTAYKMSYEKIDATQNQNTTASFITKDNNADDVYTFKSFLTYEYPNSTTGEYTQSGYKKFRDAKIEVVSKKIIGNVWEDFDAGGIMSDDESKIENVTLKLYDNDTKTLLASTTSDSNGKYTFSGLREGSYFIVAEFDRDKYGATVIPSEDYYDKTRLSVFKVDKEIILDSSVDEEEESDEADDETSDLEETEDESEESAGVIKTDPIIVNSETRIIRYQNLGLSLRKKYSIKINKYITRTEVTNALGIKTIKQYGNVKLAKLDVKDIANVNIKVVYTLELQNTKYYPGYVKLVNDTIPDGMSFNANYSENKGWSQTEDGLLVNNSLKDTLIYSNDKKYLTIALDISRKEAGSFINVASVEDLQILGGEADE